MLQHYALSSYALPCALPEVMRLARAAGAQLGLIGYMWQEIAVITNKQIDTIIRQRNQHMSINITTTPRYYIKQMWQEIAIKQININMHQTNTNTTVTHTSHKFLV